MCPGASPDFAWASPGVRMPPKPPRVGALVWLRCPEVGKGFRNLTGFENDLDRIGIGAIGHASNDHGSSNLLSQELRFADGRNFTFSLHRRQACQLAVLA